MAIIKVDQIVCDICKCKTPLSSRRARYERVCYNCKKDICIKHTEKFDWSEILRIDFKFDFPTNLNKKIILCPNCRNLIHNEKMSKEINNLKEKIYELIKNLENKIFAQNKGK